MNQPDGRVIPNPDPSTITSQAIDREVANAIALVTAKIAAIDARIDGMEKAVEVFQADLTRVPTQLDRAILGLRELTDANVRGVSIHLTGMVERLEAIATERFSGLLNRFAERDTRTEQRASDSKLAIDAALASAKETTNKIEYGITKQIDAMANIIDSKTSNLSGGIGDLKERLTALESRTVGITAGRTESRSETSDSRGFIFSLVSVIISFGLLMAAVFIHLK